MRALEPDVCLEQDSNRAYPRGISHRLSPTPREGTSGLNRATSGLLYPTSCMPQATGEPMIPHMAHLAPSTSVPASGRRSRAAGFSMVEVLVSIVVLSFGLLGVVGLQASALKFGRDARQQSIAVGLARELAEMMRANAQEAGKATSNPYLGAFSGSPLQPATTSTCLAVGSTCNTAADVANAQMTDWLARVEAQLPGARVVTCLDTAPYDAAGLPQWTCTAPTGTAAPVAVIKLGWTRETTANAIQGASDTGAKPFVVLPVTPGGQT